MKMEKLFLKWDYGAVRYSLLLLMAIFFLMPIAAFAEGISRRDGFLLLWESIQRPVVSVREEPFIDVPTDEAGGKTITYAKNRGVLDDEPRFRPDDPLILEDALLWLYRTRNVRELPEMQRDDLWGMITQYSIVAPDADLYSRVASQDVLIALMRSLDEMLGNEVHEVSLYGEEFHGKGTAFGETFDMHAITAAHRSFPQNTLVKVTNVDNGKSVVVRINDRGPYVEGRDMDLSAASFTTIAERSKGVIRARFMRLGDATLIAGCGAVPRFQQRITRDTRFQRGVPHMWSVGKEIILKSNHWFVVRAIVFPDGSRMKIQDWVAPEERFTFTPVTEGEYTFVFSSKEGQKREMRMQAFVCSMS